MVSSSSLYSFLWAILTEHFLLIESSHSYIDNMFEISDLIGDFQLGRGREPAMQQIEQLTVYELSWQINLANQ